MRKLLRAISSTILWSYERGSWPYDVMVVVIVIFVLVAPRHWFHDQPENIAASPAGITLLSEDANARTEVFRLDAALFGSSQPRAKSAPELEEKAHQILSNSIDDLKGRHFQVQKILQIRDSSGSPLYYQVQVKH